VCVTRNKNEKIALSGFKTTNTPSVRVGVCIQFHFTFSFWILWKLQ